MTWDDLESLLRARRHTDELSALRSEVAKEGLGSKVTTRRILQEQAQIEISDLVEKYMTGKHVEGGTSRHQLARRVAATLLEDVRRGTDRTLQRIAEPSPDRLVDQVPRGTQRMDCESALRRLETFLRDEGGLLRVVGDRESFTAIYRETGATASSLLGAIADLAGKLERVGVK